MSYKTSFKDGRLGIGLSTSENGGAPRYPLDINGDIRLTGAILKSDGTTYTSGSGMGTPGIVSNQTDGVFKIGVNNINPTAALDISGDVLPSLTGTFDLGSVDRRWKDVFITENSFWIGDRHKMSISSTGRMRFRKRKKHTLPKKIRNMAQFANAGTTADAHAKTVAVRGQTFTDINNMTMADVVTYVRENVTGMEKASVSDIYEDDDEDYEDDNDIEGDMKISGDLQLTGTLRDSAGAARIFSNWTLPGGADAGTSHIYRNSQVTIGSSGANGSGYKLYVNGTIATNNGLYHKNYQYYISDTNTRRYWDSNNIYWSCSPSWEMALYNGNLGIGETSPTSKLTIKGGGIFFKQSTHHQGTRPAGPSNGTTTSDFEIASYGAGSYPNDMGFLRLRAGNNSNHTRIDLSAYTPSTGHECHKNITFYTSGTERMRIDKNGYVKIQQRLGIGREPSYVLDVNTVACFRSYIFLEGTTFRLTATSSYYGGIKIGYTESGKNYPVELSNGQAYVNVPWTDTNTNTTYSVGDGGLTTKNFTAALKTKLDGLSSTASGLNTSSNVTFCGVTWDGSPTTWGSLRMGGQQQHGGWMGIQMGHNGGEPNWMANNAGSCAGLHWNGSGEWAWYAYRDGAMHIRYNGGERISTTSYGQSLRYRTWINSESNGTCVLCVKSSHSPSDHAVTECHGRSGGWAGYTSAYYYHNDRRHAYQGWAYMYATSEGNMNNESVGLFSSGFWNHGYSFHSSDRRIKEEIEDVPDDKALEMVRNIPCRYYKYKDVTKKRYDSSNNEIKTIGFIAQEVREHFPLSVRIEKNTIIPSIQEIIENFEWEEITDSSNNIKYKLITDEITNDIYNIKYRFHVSNDLSGVGQEEIEVVGESDNTFIFDKKWDNIFCYGYHVDDFHILDKAKLFALNFSATQELDRKVITLEAENQELKDRLKKIEEYLGL